jgi:hypothetical protein
MSRRVTGIDFGTATALENGHRFSGLSQQVRGSKTRDAGPDDDDIDAFVG